MVEIDLSERALGDEQLKQAVNALRTDGFVVLSGLVDPEHIRVLREGMLADVERLLARPDRPFNWNPGNLQQNPPPNEPYLFRDVLVNDTVVAVTKAILGKGPTCAFYSGNTAMPSESRQPVHADSGQLWPDLDVATPPYSLVVNVPLVDMDERNGSTEIWPGTHLDTTIVMQDGDITVPDSALEERRKACPPIQPAVKAGSFLIRDIRLWHAGMPNRTQNPRPMVAMIHNVGWWHVEPIRFPKGTEWAFEHPELRWVLDLSAESVDHIAAPKSYAYEGETKGI